MVISHYLGNDDPKISCLFCTEAISFLDIFDPWLVERDNGESADTGSSYPLDCMLLKWGWCIMFVMIIYEDRFKVECVTRQKEVSMFLP